MASGAVSRNLRDGAPRCEGDYTTNEFAVTLPGATAELVYISGSSPAVFRAKVDEGYLEARLDVANNEWVVFDATGARYTFGDSGSARSYRGSDVLMNTSACEFTTSWALTEIRDLHGNTIEFVYTNDEQYLYVDEILYGGNRDSSDSIRIEHPFRVTFNRSARSNSPVSFRSGVRTEQGEEGGLDRRVVPPRHGYLGVPADSAHTASTTSPRRPATICFSIVSRCPEHLPRRSRTHRAISDSLKSPLGRRRTFRER